MMNYIISENYRIIHKKALYITSSVCLILITVAAAVLNFFQQQEPDFAYGTSQFYYSNVVGGGVLITIVGFLFSIMLTGKDMSVLKNSISFGISRQTIFWSKLIVTLVYFLVFSLIGGILIIGLGESLLINDDSSVQQFLLAGINMIPIILGLFFMAYSLKMIRFGDVYIMVILLFLLIFSGDLLNRLLHSVPQLENLYRYAPSTLLNDNLMQYMNQGVTFDYRIWMAGIVISIISLGAGSLLFSDKAIS